MAETDILNADFARKFPDKFARLLGRGEIDEIAQLLKRLPRPVAASIVARLPVTRIGALLASAQNEPENWLADAPFNDAVALLSRIPREQSLTLVNSVKNRERRRRLLQSLKYPAHSVGALVTDVPLRISADTPAPDVLAELRTLDHENPRPLVVVHPDGRYFGMLDSWRLLTGKQLAGPIGEYASPAPAIYPETSLATAILDPSWHNYNWLPVVDHELRILGGVSRYRVFSAASQHTKNARSGTDIMTILIEDVVYLFGALLTRSLSRRNTS